MKRREFVIGGAVSASRLVVGGLSLTPVAGALAQAPEAPFRVGALCPVTGAGSPYGPGMQKMIVAMAEAVNAAGGVNGRRFEVYAEDTQTKPEPAVLAAKKLVEVNKVQAILGTWSSSETMAVLTSVTEPAGVLHFTVTGAREFSFEDKKDFGWRFTPSSYAYGLAYAKIAMDMGVKRPATMGFNNPSGLAQAAGFADAWKKLGGTLAGSVVYEANRPSYRSELQSVLANKPDLVVVAGYVPDTTIILREWYQTGVPAKFILPSWGAGDKLVETLGANVVDGIVTVGAGTPENSPSAKACDELYRKLTGNPVSANFYSTMCFDMVNVLALAMQAAGPGANPRIAANIETSPTRRARSCTRSPKGGLLKRGTKIKYSGAYSDLRFDENGDDSAALFTWNAYKAGKSELVRQVSLA
ncbi:MAG: ABC transporter substrate-binding protein [Burkholderiales bacterium]